MRADKFLWAVRLFKTRRLAVEACTGGRVLVNGDAAKQSKVISCEMEVQVRTPPIWRKYRVIDIPESRVGARLVANYLEEHTSEEDLKQLQLVQLANRQHRIEGRLGRPTKKDRRDLDEYL